MNVLEALNNELLPYALLAIAVAILLHVVLGGGAPPSPPPAAAKDEAEEEPDPPRNFSPAQLRRFDGGVHADGPKFDLDAGKVRIALKGLVYDVTAGASFYGPGGTYHVFAGRDASRALAKLSFEEADLANPRVDDLSAQEKDQLGDWIAKFEMKRYPVVGRLVAPPLCRAMAADELQPFNGTQPRTGGRVDPPLYVGCAGKVFDVSFGGFEMYKPGAGYHRFAGLDASRALAKMSFEEADVHSRALGDLSPDQLKVMHDWAAKFEHQKLYPVVGTLEPFGA